MTMPTVWLSVIPLWLHFDGGDCNDLDSTIYPGAVEVWYDGIDGDCDGMSDNDADMDGEDSDQYGGTDCDDTNAELNLDNDMDGFSTCDGDCDDESDVTYPMAYNDSATECLTDFDGDGYGALETSCFEPSLWTPVLLTMQPQPFTLMGQSGKPTPM